MAARITFFLLALSAGAALETLASSSSFMLISGVSAPAEMCLSVEGSSDADGTPITLEPCAQAIAAGDGRELWQQGPGGQITNVLSKKCIGLKTAEAGSAVLLTDCDHGQTAWEVQGNGQLKLGGAGQYCLSQEGAAAGSKDVAASSAISASSAADPEAHGANKAVDSSSSTFWASALDPAEPVTLTIDLGAQQKLESLSIDWEFPAKAFAVGLSADGVKWTEVFATDSNVLASTSVPLGYASATKLRIVMHEAHAVYGIFKGHSLYGVADIKLLAASMQSVVTECGVAAKSADARDKYFQSYVGEAGICSSSSLRSEVPSLEAARASVASTVSELVDVLPKLASCRRQESFLQNSMGVEGALDLRGRVRSQADVQRSASQTTKDVDAPNGIQASAVLSLMKEARQAVITARAMLF